MDSSDVVTLFLQQAGRLAKHPAVVGQGVETSYGDLRDIVCRLAAQLSEVSDHPRVAIHATAGFGAYAAMLATLMAGGFYAPLNTASPIEKQRRILGQFRPDVVLSDSDQYEDLVSGVVDCPVMSLVPLEVVPLTSPKTAHELAYVIFTSGSTGVPKGVMVGRKGLANYVSWALRAMNVTPEDRWSQHPNIGFDLSVLDIYGALCGGATLFPLDDNDRRFAIGRAVKRLGLTIWNSVPSVIDLLIASRQLTSENLETLRLMTFCGEPLLPAHVAAIKSECPDLKIHNTYGPTEATVSCTLLEIANIAQPEISGGRVALGSPIDNMQIHLVGGATPDEGEIVISGPQVAAGYWDQPEATERQFRTVTIDGRTQRAYFTGDWAERRSGNLFFLNRIDTQVKIKGYRVELDEVATAIRECGFIAACLVIENELHAFVESSPKAFDPEKLAAQLLQKLDADFVPRWFHRYDQLPRNANDKIDALALQCDYESGTLND